MMNDERGRRGGCNNSFGRRRYGWSFSREGFMPHMKSDGIQLYTLRDLTAKDFAGTMKAVAKLGYKFVETAGYGDLKTAKAAKAAIDAAGLKASSGHFAIDVLEKNIEQVVADAQTLEIDTVVCPFLPEERRRDGKGYEATAKALETAGS